jgi:hypothetical protein
LHSERALKVAIVAAIPVAVKECDATRPNRNGAAGNKKNKGQAKESRKSIRRLEFPLPCRLFRNEESMLKSYLL